MRKDFLRRLDKKLALLVGSWLVERRCNRLRLGSTAQLLGRPPVGTAGIEWIEDDVLALQVIESLDELAGRVVDDGGMAALPDLEKKLHDEPGFACTGVSHDLDMLAFDLARDTHRTARFEGLKSHSVPLHGAIERARRHQSRSLQEPSILALAKAFDVFAYRKRKLDEEANEAQNSRPEKESSQASAAIDKLLQEGMEGLIPVGNLLAARDGFETFGPCSGAQLNRQRAAIGLRSLARFHIFRQGWVGALLSIDYCRELVTVGLLDNSQNAGFDVDRKIEPLQPRPRQHGPEISGNHRHEHSGSDRGVGIDRSTRRRDEGLFSAPWSRVHGRSSPLCM